MRTILSDLGLESRLVGTTVTAHIASSGPDAFVCTVYDVATGQGREAVLPRREAYDIPDGTVPPPLRCGDSVIALVVGVDFVTHPEAPGARPAERLMLSAVAPGLVERVLSGFVAELLTGDVVVKGVARVAGTKSKIAVAPTRPGVEAKGACIGRGASRLRGAENLLNRGYGREKLEIIEYSGDRAVFLANAMSPVRVTGVLVEGDSAVVAVEPHQLSGGIGEGGLNAQLAGRLTGLFIRVVRTGTDLRAALSALRADRAAAVPA